MKCPKCSHISFDFNELCPRCGRDISAERQKMNLPHYMAAPPFLLGKLVGEADRFSPDPLASVEGSSGLQEIPEGSSKGGGSKEQDFDLDIDLGELELEQEPVQEQTEPWGAVYDEREMVTRPFIRKRLAKDREVTGTSSD